MPSEDITRTPFLPHLERVCAKALQAGALGPIHTDSERVTDDGIAFVVRTISNLARKQAATRPDDGGDPFAPPYDPPLHVGHVPPDHVALLNKFPVIENHLLVVTRHFRDQVEPLEPEDFQALLRVLAQFDALAFYNAGPEAGASQAHCHLQFIPRLETLPLEPSIAAGRPLPFPCDAVDLDPAWLQEPEAGARAMYASYRTLLQRIGRSDPASGSTGGPYNLLVTREHAWAVPRSREWYGPVNVNALGYAGLLLAADCDQARLIRDDGPLHVITSTADHP